MQYILLQGGIYMKLNKIVKEYLESIRYSVKRKTYLFYLHIADIYMSSFTGIINNKNLNEYFISLKERLSYSSVKIIKNLINRSLKFAFDNKLIKTACQISVKFSANQSKKAVALSKGDQQKIEKYVLQSKKYYHYGIIIALYTGLRIGELLALKWTDIDLKNKLITVNRTIEITLNNHKMITFEDLPKTSSSIRELPISKELLLILNELKRIAKTEYVLMGYKHTPIKIRAYQKIF